MGEIRGDGSQENGGIARTTGILRSWESIGSTIAYAIGATGVSNLNQMIVGFVLWGVTVPFTLCAIYGNWTVVEKEEQGTSSEEESSVIEASVSAGGKGIIRD